MKRRKKQNNTKGERHYGYAEIAPILRSGGIGILKTDTIYGLVGLAMSKKSVEKIYKLKKRESKKPFIILVSSLRDLELFRIKLDEDIKKKLKIIWPGKTSVILPCQEKKFSYLHRGKKSLAFRWPKKKNLVELIKKIGPLVAPSANVSGKNPAQNVSQAKEYFYDSVDFYINEGRSTGKPSTLISFALGKAKVIRK